MIEKRLYSRDIKRALEIMNSDVENDIKYDYADDYVLNDEVYTLKEIDNELYIERINHTDQDEEEGFEKLQKIICDNPEHFIDMIELVRKEDELSNAKELLKQHNL